MSVAMEFMFVSKSVTTPMALTTVSATQATDSMMMATHAKVSTNTTYHHNLHVYHTILWC